jgi:hypothetical protein
MEQGVIPGARNRADEAPCLGLAHLRDTMLAPPRPGPPDLDARGVPGRTHDQGRIVDHEIGRRDGEREIGARPPVERADHQPRTHPEVPPWEASEHGGVRAGPHQDLAVLRHGRFRPHETRDDADAEQQQHHGDDPGGGAAEHGLRVLHRTAPFAWHTPFPPNRLRRGPAKRSGSGRAWSPRPLSAALGGSLNDDRSAGSKEPPIRLFSWPANAPKFPHVRVAGPS